MDIYTVKEGDTLYKIAKEFSVSRNFLARDNAIADNRLAVGQNLLIVYPKTVHTVKKGETLKNISDYYNVSEIDILRNNYGLLPNELFEGQSLVIETTDAKGKEIVLNSYAYPYISDKSLYYQMPYQTYLSPFTYGFTQEGELIDLNDKRLIAASEEYEVMPYLHLSTLTKDGGFSNELASVVLRDKEKQKILAENILGKIKEKGFYGLDIDFEFVYSDESVLYAEFVEFMKSFLNPYGYRVIVALAPKTSNTQQGSIYEGHNYKLLGEAGNLAFVMTYEWGYTYGPPLAVSPLNSVKRVLDYAVSEIPNNKILMGLPNYAYDWKLPYIKGETRAELIGNLRAVEIAIENNREILFDENSFAPYFYYNKLGDEHIIWFDDAKSIAAKAKLIGDYDFSGAGIWNMMREFPQLWIALNNLYKIM